MNRNEFNRFIAGIDLPGPADLEELRELVALFPWFHSAHMLLLRGLKDNSDIRFDTQLKASALSVADREVLYHYLFLSPAEGELKTAPADSLVKEETVPSASAPAEITADAEQVTVNVEVTRPPVEPPIQPPVEPPIQPPVEPAEAAEPASENVDTPEDSPETSVSGEPQEPATSAVGTAEAAEPPEDAEPPEVAEPPEDAELPEVEKRRTREELIAEIEARLRELEQIHLSATVHEIEQETETAVAVTTEPVAEHEPAMSTEPEPAAAESEFKPEPEPEPAAAESEFKPEPVPAPVIQARSEIDWEYEPVKESETEAEPEEEELLELITGEPYGPEELSMGDEPAVHLSPADLIDRFIRISPSIERMAPGDSQPVKDLSAERSQEQGKFITETLAVIYINQGYYTKAINIYERLSLQYPEKSAYFASRIEKIKELIK